LTIKKFFNVLVIFMVFVLTMAPSAEAWGWKTHSDIVDAIYYGLPPEVQKNLNLQTMKDESNDPDEVFKDFTTHSYPNSYGKAKSWLDKGKSAYDRGDYNEASYDYGVASHYISDTFSTPHCMNKEESSDHTKYEDQAKNLKPVVTCDDAIITLEKVLTEKGTEIAEQAIKLAKHAGRVTVKASDIELAIKEL
jgi:hypothetical protein